jgi:hypothetical protein
MVFKFFQRRFIQVSMVVLITLTLIGGFWGIGQAAAVDLINSYSILKNQYPGYVDKIVAGGASESQIEAFLIDLDSEVSSRGTLNEANFNSVMYQSLQEVLTMHTDVFNAMLSSFPEEIAYTIKNGKLHSNLIPLRNAVMETVLSQKTPPGGVGPGGGPLSGDTDDKVMSEVADQITSGKSVINLSLSNNNSIGLYLPCNNRHRGYLLLLR